MQRALVANSTDRAPIALITAPFLRFAQMEASSGILLLAATAAALFWANSSWQASYHALWSANFALGAGSFTISESRLDWVNDGLMSIFFFLVGLEIKREVLIGELASLKQAAFPFIAALGGSLVPALLYLALNHGHGAARGWGIPMATDIAFALGLLALLGDRVPQALKVFVAALAIVDDIFAVLVIALFYTDHISVGALCVGLAGVGVSFAANRLGVRHPAVYAVLGVLVWLAVLHSGVHATIAGILMAFTIPAGTAIDRPRFLAGSRASLDRIEQSQAHSTEGSSVIRALERQCEMAGSPLERMEHALQPWVSFLIMPLFALANAGVHFLGRLRSEFGSPIAMGIFFGLLLGKPLGISAFTWLSSAARFAAKPASISWKQIFAASWLCGIGFTMSLFIAGLAFTDAAVLDRAKIGVLMASIAAGSIGAGLLRSAAKP